MARGDHGLPKVSHHLGLSTLCGWTNPVGGSPAERPACGRLLPLWTPHAVRLCIHQYLLDFFSFGERLDVKDESVSEWKGKYEI
jgi:hypothetical protein